MIDRMAARDCVNKPLLGLAIASGLRLCRNEAIVLCNVDVQEVVASGEISARRRRLGGPSVCRISVAQL